VAILITLKHSRCGSHRATRFKRPITSRRAHTCPSRQWNPSPPGDDEIAVRAAPMTAPRYFRTAARFRGTRLRPDAPRGSSKMRCCEPIPSFPWSVRSRHRGHGGSTTRMGPRWHQPARVCRSASGSGRERTTTRRAARRCLAKRAHTKSSTTTMIPRRALGQPPRGQTRVRSASPALSTNRCP
jgi:hypothetical protein